MEILVRWLDDLLILGLVALVPLTTLKRQYALAWRLTATALLSWGVAIWTKTFFNTSRPYLLYNLEPFVNRPPTDGAFPSAHAATAFGIATTVYLFDSKWGGVAYLVALLVGVMRVVGRVHYPIDILGGALLGIIISLTVQWLSGKLLKPKLLPGKSV